MSSTAYKHFLPNDLLHARVLVLDCQTTGSNADNSHVIEIGWMSCRAADPIDTQPPPVHTSLVQLPQNAVLSERVARLTGISGRSLAKAPSASRVYGRVANTAAALAAALGLPMCPTIIHYARFEKPFLVHLHRQSAVADPLPFNFICTHAIACRMLSHLPRKGLRAVAGYLGHTVPEDKRSGHHVLATAIVWRRLVQRLIRTESVRTLSDLERWLSGGNRRMQSVRSYPLDAKKRLDLPDRPGVYKMRLSNGDVLYVGKAQSIRRRVASYFHKGRKHSEHILEMLSQARDIDHKLTDTAVEAALLESDEIKRLNPPYNIALRTKARRLCFLSPTYNRLADHPDREHSIGPLPFNEELRGLTLLVRALNRSSVQPFLDWEYLPVYLYHQPFDRDRLEQGLAVFKQRYPICCKINPVAGAIRHIGSLLWHQRIILPGQERHDDEKKAEDRPQRDELSPDDIADRFEHTALAGSHLIRRSRWFYRLSESLLTWQTRPDSFSQVDRRCLRMSGGCVDVFNDHADASFARLWLNNPPPQRIVRQQSIDLPGYDRLRIVTTELRRLIAQDRKVEIWLSPERRLQNIGLARLLAWI